MSIGFIAISVLFSIAIVVLYLNLRHQRTKIELLEQQVDTLRKTEEALHNNCWQLYRQLRDAGLEPILELDAKVVENPPDPGLIVDEKTKELMDPKTKELIRLDDATGLLMVIDPETKKFIRPRPHWPYRYRPGPQPKADKN